MLPKKNRLDKNTIENIFKNGLFVISNNLTFKFIRTPGSPTRISFIVPKTVNKKAVTRNLLRRRGYGVLSKNKDILPDKVAGAFIFGKSSTKLFGLNKNKQYNPILELENEIKTLLNKVN